MTIKLNIALIVHEFVLVRKSNSYLRLHIFSSFSGEDSLRLHIQNEHNQNIEEESTKSECISPSLSDTYCHLCNAKFNSRENYYAHMRCTHPLFQKKLDQTSSFPAPSIQKLVEKNDDSILNEYALIERTIWCEKCKRSFDSMTVYLQHYSFQHCLQIIKCLQCQDTFETLELFFNHIEKIHPSKTGKYFFIFSIRIIDEKSSFC
jgi:hypothetical protein